MVYLSMIVGFAIDFLFLVGVAVCRLVFVFFLVSADDTSVGGDVCMYVVRWRHGRSRPGGRLAVVEAEMIGHADSDELTEWQEVDWMYLTRCG